MIEFEKTIELFVLIIGLIVWKTVRPKYLHSIIILIGITVLHEMVIVPISKSTHLFKRNISYNIFSLIDIAFWYFIFYKINSVNRISKWFFLIAALIFLFNLFDICFISGWKQFHTMSFKAYNIFMVLLSAYYFYSILQKEYHSIFSDPLFWICSAVFLYHALLFINLSTIAYNNYWNLKNSHEVFNILQTIGVTTYYLLLCIAFLVGYYNHKQQIRAASYRDLLK